MPNRDLTSKNSDSDFCQKPLTESCSQSAAINKHLAVSLPVEQIIKWLHSTHKSRCKASRAESNLPVQMLLLPASHRSKETFINQSEQLFWGFAHNHWPAFCFFASVRLVLSSSLTQHKEWSSHSMKVYSEYFHWVCVDACLGSEPVTAVYSWTCENCQHAWHSTNRQVGPFHTNKWVELWPLLKHKFITWVLLHKTKSMMIRF